MCLILYVPKGKEFPMHYVDNIYGNNEHGFGMMWTDDKKKVVEGVKGLYNLKQIKNMIKAGPKDKVAYHFRYSTRGHINAANVHPFVIQKNLWMMHNGTMDIKPTNKHESDTSTFASLFREMAEEDNTDYFLNEDCQESVVDLIGSNNRMLFMGFKEESRRVNLIGDWYILPKSGTYVSNTYSLREPFTGKHLGKHYGYGDFDWSPVYTKSNKEKRKKFEDYYYQTYIDDENERWNKWRDKYGG